MKTLLFSIFVLFPQISLAATPHEIGMSGAATGIGLTILLFVFVGLVVVIGAIFKEIKNYKHKDRP